MDETPAAYVCGLHLSVYSIPVIVTKSIFHDSFATHSTTKSPIIITVWYYAMTTTSYTATTAAWLLLC